MKLNVVVVVFLNGISLLPIASLCISSLLCFSLGTLIGLLGVSEYSDICGSECKIEYEYSSLPKSLDHNLFFFLPFLLLKQEVFHKMVH